MASKMVANLRRMIRSKPSEWLEDCISPMGRGTAAGWNYPGTTMPHTEGVITIGIIRAELRRRELRAAKRERRN